MEGFMGHAEVVTSKKSIASSLSTRDGSLFTYLDEEGKCSLSIDGKIIWEGKLRKKK